MQEGFDLSKAQSLTNWDTVKLSSKSFCFIKATDGIVIGDDIYTAVDKQFADNWNGAKNTGIVRGAYHFFRPTRPVADQVAIFYDTVKALDVGDLPPALDVEIPKDDITAWDGFTAATAVATILDCLSKIQNAFGRKPVIYMNHDFYQTVLNEQPGGLTAYPLWWAQPEADTPSSVPDDWETWKFWQYSFTGTVAGINSDGQGNSNTDLDRFNGDANDLTQFIQNSVV